MGSELDIRLGESACVGVALILDGRERVEVPQYRSTGSSNPPERFHVITPGPVMILNPTADPLELRLLTSDSAERVSRYLLGGYFDPSDYQTLLIPPGAIETLAPSHTFLGIRVGSGNGVLRPVSVPFRGPSTMPLQAVMAITLG